MYFFGVTITGKYKIVKIGRKSHIKLPLYHCSIIGEKLRF